MALLLRIYGITKVPPSLFGDELDLGYQAYSILKTGRDYSGNFMPLHFHSLAEWRTPLYLYAAVPTVGIFGISPLGVRLPAVIFGVLGVWGMYLLVSQISDNKRLALLSSLVLAFNPWHIQYSRAGFEVTMFLAFLIFGMYFFFKGIKNNGSYLWASGLLLVLTPLIYSTAKLFTLLLFVFLFLSYRKSLLKLSKKNLVIGLGVTFVVGLLVSYATLFSGGSQRFNYISVFSDPTIEPEIGVDRLRDAMMRGETGTGLSPKLLDRIIHNKFTFVGERVVNNMITSLSFDFLFVNGDPNPRHMMDDMGMFIKVEIITLALGTLFFFLGGNKEDSKTKILILFWILVGIFPAAITRDGGNHATRLIVVLPALTFLISYGLNKILSSGKLASLIYVVSWLVFFGLYIHNYYIHYPYDSERWWHSGWVDAVQQVKKLDSGYDKVIITMADEPAWIFFAGGYEYDPAKWQQEFPIGNDVEVNGFGKISHTGKFYFGSPKDGIYSLSSVLDGKTLYLSSAKEIPWNLIQEQTRTPEGLNLLKSVAYPSGEPAFYIFDKKK